ncbi:LacI family transcriptional regulator [Humidesulfovibrio idahonensis]
MTKDWLTLLSEAVAESSKAAVAEELGVSRPAVSLLLLGKYPGKTDRMAARILERYARLDCPHTGKSVTPDHCRKFCGPVPTSSPAALRQWRACLTCPNNPNREEHAA